MSAVVCPNPTCGHSLSLALERTGRRIRCPACGTAFDPHGGKETAGRDDTVDQPSTPRTVPGAPPRIGRFQLIARLGSGAFGTVYKARDPQLDRLVALKVPNAGALNTPKRVERFLREAKAAAQLRHPNIVPVFDAGKDGERFYIAAAFVEGRPLADGVAEGGIEPVRAARIARHLAEAVAYAHDQGVVHRDIKPANVMLDRTDQPHLMDFGLAARAEEAEKLTTDGAVLGTPAYMAPEQAAGHKGEASPLSDQYSLGVLLYELLTGRTPFEGAPAAVIYKVIHHDPPLPRELRPAIPLDLQTICLKAMARRPEDRYPDCEAFADDLNRWLNEEPIHARRHGPVERLARWVRRNRAVAGLSTLVAAVLVAASVVSTGFALRANRLAADAQTASQREREANAQLLAEAEKVRAALAIADANRIAAETAAAEARQAEAIAQTARKTAEDQATLARVAQKKAEDALAGQKRAEGQATQATAALSATKLDAEYAARMTEASFAAAEGRFPEARTALDATPSTQRGPEWHLLNRWTQTARPPYRDLHLPAPWEDFPAPAPVQTALSPDGRYYGVVWPDVTDPVSTWRVNMVQIFDLDQPESPLASIKVSTATFKATRPPGTAFARLAVVAIGVAPGGESVTTVWRWVGNNHHGKTLLIARHDRAGKLLSQKVCELPAFFEDEVVAVGPDGSVLALVFHPQADDNLIPTRLVTVRPDGTMPEPVDGPRLRLPGPQTVTALHPGRRLVAVRKTEATQPSAGAPRPGGIPFDRVRPGVQESVEIFDATTGSRIGSLPEVTVPSPAAGNGVPFYWQRMRFSPDANLLAMCNREGEVHLFGPPVEPGKTWQRVSFFDSGNRSPVVYFSPDSRRVAVWGSGETTFGLYTARDGKLVCRVPSYGSARPPTIPGQKSIRALAPSLSSDWTHFVGQYVGDYEYARRKQETRVRVWDWSPLPP